MTMMTIGKTAQATNVSVETIRFYERKGLIDQPLKPLESGFRIYPKETITRIRFIRQAQDLGFSLKEINELLSLQADPGADCADVQKKALAKLADVDSKIESLQKIRNALAPLIDACPRCGPLKSCSIIQAISTKEVSK